MAFLRLEKAGIVISEFEGKNKIFQFNPHYPLIEEIENLLKKAFTLLSPQEKLQYTVVKIQDGIQEAGEIILLKFWQKLNKVKKFNVVARLKNKSGENHKGVGEVIVIKESENSLIFNEKGKWINNNIHAINFSNVYRWVLNVEQKTMAIEHLRRGFQHPVFLIHLSPITTRKLSSVNTHLCEKDTYFGQLFFDQYGLHLNWRAIGPNKNEEINYYYV
ncbi:MAG: DUF6314 family protein [Parachlamydiaceae bacterium]